MTIKEALNRQPSPRPTTRTSDMYEREHEYEAQILQKGISVLKEAGIPDMLGELQEALKPNFPDVKIPQEPEPSPYERRRSTALNQDDEEARKYKLWADGTVNIGIGWNYQKSTRRLAEQEYNAVVISAEPLTESLVVHGMEYEFIPKSVWSTSEGKTVLEDAIVDAYKNPGRWIWPPHRL